jgi:molybdate transport system ATP-binding protein
VLDATFVKRFAGGPSIRARLLEPTAPPTVTAILGSSGGGKTTILRCLAGLERPDEGRIEFGAECWFDAARRIHVPPERRRVGLLFQDYALFPHMTVAGNIQFALGDADAGARGRIAELLEGLMLGGLEARRPFELSGGQQQRVALARSIAARPRLLLLDEPLSALDVPTRDEIRQPLQRLLAQLAIPVILVTHDRIDALTLAGRVVIVESGEVVQAGPIAEVFAAPVNARVARLVGVETIAGGQVTSAERGVCVVAVERAMVKAVGSAGAGSHVDLCIRAEDVTLYRDEPTTASAQNLWRGRVESVIDMGGTSRVKLDCGFPLTALVTRAAGESLGVVPGAELWAAVKATAVTVLARSG